MVITKLNHVFGRGGVGGGWEVGRVLRIKNVSLGVESKKKLFALNP